MKSTFVSLFLIALFATAIAEDALLTQVLAPEANWLNPVSGSYIDITVSTSIELESSISVKLLVGLPFIPTSFNGYVKTSSSSCGLNSASWSGATWAASVNDVRTPLDGLSYYWVSSSATYSPDNFITLRMYLDWPTSAGWTKPIDLALVTYTGADYMILAQNTNLMPLYVLDAPSEGLSVSDVTTDTKKSVIGSTFTSMIRVTTSFNARRISLGVTGYSINEDISSLTLSYIGSDSLEYLISASQYDVDLDDRLHIRWVNETESMVPQTYAISWRITAPLTPSSCTISVYTMDKWGPNIIEKGSLPSIYNSAIVGWATGYPKVTFSYGLDAADSSVKKSYGLYTYEGTSYTYNHVVLGFRESTYDIPAGDQDLYVTIGTSGNPAYIAEGTFVNSLPAASGEEVDCDLSSTLTIHCDGLALTKGTEGRIGFKVAYGNNAKITDFAKSWLLVNGATIVSGTPTSLKTSFATPISNLSPLPNTKISEHSSSSLASWTNTNSVSLTGSNMNSYMLMSSTYNGLRAVDDTYLYWYSRVGPYDYYTGSTVSAGADSSKMFIELTVSKDISATYEDTSSSNVLAYLYMVDMRANELVQSDYYDYSGSSGWLYDAIRRQICDYDLDGLDEYDTRTCVDWYCYNDYDGDGSYDSPQPCKPIRACTATATSYLSYPQLDKDLYREGIESDSYRDDTLNDYYVDSYSDGIIEWAFPQGYGTNSLGECRPVRQCDSTDASAGNGLYKNRHTSGEDCKLTKSAAYRYCDEGSVPSDGILDQMSSDGSTTCVDVYPCDLDGDSNTELESRMDEAYCNPINPSTETMCDEIGSLDSSLDHATGHSLGSDCVSIPLCNVGTSDLWSSDMNLTSLSYSGAYDCIPVSSDDICSSWFAGTGTSGVENQARPGLGSTGANSNCVYMPACDKESASTSWIIGERIDGRTCSKDLPYCNSLMHVYLQNTIMYVHFSDSFAPATTDVGLKLQVTAGVYGTNTCYILDACDTFDGTNRNVRTEDGKGCPIVQSQLYSKYSYGERANSLKWYVHNYQGTWSENFRTYVGSSFWNGYWGLSGNSSPFYSQIDAHFCNADEDGVAKYQQPFGLKTDCVELDSTSQCSYLNRWSFGFTQFSRKGSSAGVSYIIKGIEADNGNGNSDHKCGFQLTCNERGDKWGELDETNYDLRCISVNSDDYCQWTGFYTSSWSSGGGKWSVYQHSVSSISSWNSSSDCIARTSCYLNTWINNSKYYMHAKVGFGANHYSSYRDEKRDNARMRQYAKESGLFTHEGCKIIYKTTTVARTDSWWSSTVDKTSLKNHNESRRLQYNSDGENALNVPGDLLFVEKFFSDSFSSHNPIAAATCNTGGANYNIFKIQLAKITATYVSAPEESVDVEKSFTVQTWNMIFPSPSDGEDVTSGNYNIFAFNSVSISSARNKLVADLDYDVQDMFWAVYWAAPTNDIEVELTGDASVSGLENLVVFAKQYNSDYDLDSGDIGWTTFTFNASDKSDMQFPNVFMLYGNSLGTNVDASSRNLSLFFSSVTLDSGSGYDVEDIDCVSKGISISGCEYVRKTGTVSGTVTYYTTNRTTKSGSRTVYNPLYRNRLDISIDANPDASWSIIFPFYGGSTESMYVGITDSAGVIDYYSGKPNGNSFGNGASGSYPYSVFGSVGSLYYEDLAATTTEVTAIYDGSASGKPAAAAWLIMDTGYSVGEVADTVTLYYAQTPSTTYTASTADAGYSGVMLCADYDYTEGQTFSMDTSITETSFGSQSTASDDNYYGCWPIFEDDLHDVYCNLCNIDYSVASAYTGSATSTYYVTLTNMLLPSHSGTKFSTDTLTVNYNKYGVAYATTNMNYAGALWDTSIVEIVSTEVSFPRGSHSEKLNLQFSTAYGVPDNSKIILTINTAVAGGGNEIIVDTDVNSASPPCYIVDSMGQTSSCQGFSWGTSTVTIPVKEDLADGVFTVSIYGLSAPLESSLENDLAKFQVQIQNSNSKALYDSDVDTYLTINYSSSSWGITLNELELGYDNSGWNTYLSAKVSTTKKLYEGDYWELSISGFTNNDESVECNIWTTGGDHATSVSRCDVNSLSSILLYPGVSTNSEISNYAYYITLNNIFVPNSFSGATLSASIVYNNGLTAKTATANLPSPKVSMYTLSDMTVDVAYDYIGYPSTLMIDWVSTVAVNTSSTMVVALSKNWGYTRTELGLRVTVNGDESKCEIDDWNTIRIVGIKSAIKVGNAVSIEIAGLDTPNMPSGEARKVYMGVCSDDAEDDNTMKATASASISWDPSDLSSVAAMYPQFKTLSKYTARSNADLAMTYIATSSWVSGTKIVMRAAGMGNAYVKAGSVSCSMKSKETGVEHAQSCKIVNNIVTYTLKYDLVMGDTYAIKLTNLPNNDWATCGVDTVQMSAWNSDASSMLGLSAGAYDNSPQIDISDPSYSLEISGVTNRLSEVGLNIGFYHEFELYADTGVFLDNINVELVGDKGFLEQGMSPYTGYNGFGLVGYETMTVTIGVKDSAYETNGLMELEADSGDLYRPPVVPYDVEDYQTSLTINGGNGISVELGGSSLPVMICAGDIPVSEHTFTITITPVDETLDPKITADMSEFTLDSESICTHIVFNATNADAEVELSSIVTIAPKSAADEMFPSVATTVTITAATTVALTATVDVADPEEFSVTMTITPSLSSLVAMYVAPSAHYRLIDPLDSETAGMLMGQYLSPESAIEAYVAVENVEIVVDNLLRGVTYNYSVLVMGPDSQEVNITGYFTTSMGDLSRSAAAYNLTVVGNYTEEELLEAVCELPVYYAIPEEDVATLNGNVCYTAINYADEMIYTGGSGVVEEDYSDSGSSARMLQSSSSSYSDSSDAVDLTVRSAIEYIVLYPIRSWVPDYTAEPIDGLTLTEELAVFLEDSWDVDEVSDSWTVEINDVTSVTTGTQSATTSSISVLGSTVNDALGDSVSGSICYALFLGTVEVTQQMIAGNTDVVPVDNACVYAAGDPDTVDVVIEGLSPDTSYTYGYYGKSSDPREYAQGTEAMKMDVKTSSVVTEVEEEEEYGLISSIGFVALLLAAIFHF